MSFAHFTHFHMSDEEAARLDSLCDETPIQRAGAFERKKPDDTEGGDLD